MSSIVLSIICVVLEFIVFLFVVISTPLDILRAQNNALGLSQAIVEGTSVHRACYSVWGKKRCGPHRINPQDLPYRGYPNDQIYKIAKAAAAFDIISIAATLVCLIVTMLTACKCCGSGIAAVVMSIVCIITIIVAIGCMLGAYYHKIAELGNIKVKDAYNLYSGVGIIVAGWCLQVIEFVIVLISALCCTTSDTPKEAEEPEPTEE